MTKHTVLDGQAKKQRFWFRNTCEAQYEPGVTSPAAFNPPQVHSPDKLGARRNRQGVPPVESHRVPQPCGNDPVTAGRPSGTSARVGEERTPVCRARALRVAIGQRRRPSALGSDSHEEGFSTAAYTRKERGGKSGGTRAHPVFISVCVGIIIIITTVTEIAR